MKKKKKKKKKKKERKRKRKEKRKKRKEKKRKEKKRKRKEKKRKEKKRKEKERKGKERKGKERKGKERKGKERKGKEGRKEGRKEERADRNRSPSTIARTGPFLLFACVETPHSDTPTQRNAHGRQLMIPSDQRRSPRKSAVVCWLWGFNAPLSLGRVSTTIVHCVTDGCTPSVPCGATFNKPTTSCRTTSPVITLLPCDLIETVFVIFAEPVFTRFAAFFLSRAKHTPKYDVRASLSSSLLKGTM